MSPPDDLAARLEAVRARRGYLLPHHGLLAVTAPRLLEAYDAAYAALALEDRVLSHHDREFVWLAILIAVDEAVATHHVEKFERAGGSPEEVEAALAVAGLARGFAAWGFVDAHWRAHLPGLDPEAAWARALKRAGAGAETRLLHLAALASLACVGAWTGLRWQLRAAYDDGAPEAEMAEALSLVMFPGSVPRFVEAAEIWLDMIRSGGLAASPAFRSWAEMGGQEGHRGGGGGAGGRGEGGAR